MRGVRLVVLLAIAAAMGACYDFAALSVNWQPAQLEVRDLGAADLVIVFPELDQARARDQAELPDLALQPDQARARDLALQACGGMPVRLDCNGAMTDVCSDSANCGSCGTVCTFTCLEGACFPF